MLKLYTIQSGQFKLDDGTLRGAGDTIELEEDVAALHAGRLAVQEPAVQTPAPEADE
jgi:hypothetical protein